MILRPYQEAAVSDACKALDKHKNTIVVAPTGCHAPGTMIMMADGTSRAVETLRVGDQVMGPDSTPRTILELHRGTDEMFQVSPVKGESFVVNAGHIFHLYVTPRAKGKNSRFEEVTAQEFYDSRDWFKHIRKLHRASVSFGEKPVQIHPWLMGVILGDGTIRKKMVSISTPDDEIVDGASKCLEPFGCVLRCSYEERTAKTYRIVDPETKGNRFRDAVGSYGLLDAKAGEKFVPDDYKFNGMAVRLEMIAGLIDTDGSLSNAGYDWISKSKRLAEDMVWLCRSVGLAAYIQQCEKSCQNDFTGTYYRVSISGNTRIIPCRVSRKRAPERKQIKRVDVTGFSLSKIGSGQYYGFTLDGDHLYLTSDFVVHHNSGKTIMLSALIGKRHKKDKRILVLQHRDELVAQNRAKFLKVNPYITTSIVDGTMKDWSGDAIFSMVQTLSRENNLSKRPKFDMVVIDESHHAAADTYLKVIEAVRKDNKNAEVVGFTATPNRGDKKGLKNVFTNCSHQIQLATLIREGFLVPPKAYVIDVGVRGELEGVRKLASDFDMDQVEAIMNKRVINDAIVEKWRELAGDRKTVVFCSTIAHAEGVCEAFVDAGVNAKTVTGDTPKDARKQILHDLEFGDVQVVVNVAVLTEGFDAQPVSCVILTRPCSYKATMVQMIGRGLRTVDPEIHPGVIKKDCIVIDFGTSILTHGELDDAVDLDGKEANANPGESPEKQCPECHFIIPQNARECPNCGHSFSAPDKETLVNFELTEVDLIGRSPFRWIDPFGTGACKMATGFNGFGIVIETAEDTCIAIVKAQGGRTRVVSIGTKMQATAAADDFMREVEDSTGANKTKRWLSQPVSDKQREHLARHGVLIGPMDYSWDRYKAACWLNYLWNRQAIDGIINKMGYTNAA